MTSPEHSPGHWSYEYGPNTLRSVALPPGVGAEIPAFEIFDADCHKVFDTNEDILAELQEANAPMGAAALRLLAPLITYLTLSGPSTIPVANTTPEADIPYQTKMSPPIQPGDTVAYKQSYVDRQSLRSENLMYARGKITALHHIANGLVLADVDWDTAGLPKRVYVKDLVRV